MSLIRVLQPLNLFANLSTINTNQFDGKLELFLICKAVSKDLKLSGYDESDCNYLEELSLKCLNKNLSLGKIKIDEIQMLIRELPEIVKFKYPVVNEIKNLLTNYLEQYKYLMKMNLNQIEYQRIDYIIDLIK